jgi:hypothetical protein
MQTIVLETFLAFGLCLAAVFIFAIADSYRAAELRHTSSRPAIRPVLNRSPFAFLLPRHASGRSCLIDGLLGH